MKDLLNHTELQDFIKEHKVAVIKFYTTTCVPCKILAPVLEMMETRFPELAFAKYNAENTEGIEHLDIVGVPAILIFDTGKEISRTLGLKSQQVLETMFKFVVEAKA